MRDVADMVVFDLFGTLIRFGLRHHPYRKILTWAKEQGRRPYPDDARILMTINKPPHALFAQLGIAVPSAMLEKFHHEVDEELSSLTLFDDVEPTMTAIMNRGVRLAVCSNLAAPYGRVLQDLLPAHPDLLRCLSYDVGAIKPDPAIYRWLEEHSGIAAKKMLFVGDNYIADVEGPRSVGMNALYLKRNSSPGDGSIGSLIELILTKDKEDYA